MIFQGFSVTYAIRWTCSSIWTHYICNMHVSYFNKMLRSFVTVSILIMQCPKIIFFEMQSIPRVMLLYIKNRPAWKILYIISEHGHENLLLIFVIASLMPNILKFITAQLWVWSVFSSCSSQSDLKWSPYLIRELQLVFIEHNIYVYTRMR